jgi:hypothetical protein
VSACEHRGRIADVLAVVSSQFQAQPLSAPIEWTPEFHAGTPRPLLRLPREVVEASISPDGQRVYVIVPKQTIGRGIILVVMNWAAELQEQR